MTPTQQGAVRRAATRLERTARRLLAIDHGGLHCASYRGREVGLPARYHTVACARASGGPIAGFVLRRGGAAWCPITGWHDGQCVEVTVCGQASVACE